MTFLTVLEDLDEKTKQKNHLNRTKNIFLEKASLFSSKFVYWNPEKTSLHRLRHT